MSVTRIPIDGLWRCLCPAIDQIALSFAARQRKPLRRNPHRPRLEQCLATKAARSTKSYQQTRRIHSTSRRRQGELTDNGNIEQRTSNGRRTRLDKLPQFQALSDVPIANLHETLRALKTEEGSFKKVSDLVMHLVKERGDKPSLLHYDALIRANADARYGSAGVVADLLKDMEMDGVSPDAGLYHSVLQVLAVHPDYLLRIKVLQEMKERWITLTIEGWHNVVVGLLRDQQYEMALDKLEQMQAENIRIAPWLYDIFIYQLCDISELDEALRILQYRVSCNEIDISANVWYYMLDACSSAFHYQGTLYVWQRKVETSRLNPSDGVCVNVLNTAGRHKDSALATDVIRVLAARSTKLDYHHYEALLEAYVGSNDIKTAMRVLCIMKRARLEPDEGSTRSLYTYLAGDPSRRAEAYEILEQLHADGQDIPVAAYNAIIEASSVHLDIATASTHYKALHLIVSSGPNTQTFNALLQCCVKVTEATSTSHKDFAMFLASEMSALGVLPDSLTYDRFILLCLNENDHEDAFKYLEEMKEMGWRPRQGTYTALVKDAASTSDPRVKSLLADMEEAGMGTAKLRAIIEQQSEEVAPPRRASI